MKKKVLLILIVFLFQGKLLAQGFPWEGEDDVVDESHVEFAPFGLTISDQSSNKRDVIVEDAGGNDKGNGKCPHCPINQETYILMIGGILISLFSIKKSQRKRLFKKI